SMPVKSWKSLGSGDVDQVPPKTAGKSICNCKVAHPPEECPCRKRPLDRASMRYFFSRLGMYSFVNAVPQGPLFTESSNSCVPVGHDSSSMTQIIGGTCFFAIRSNMSPPKYFAPLISPPNPWVQ